MQRGVREREIVRHISVFKAVIYTYFPNVASSMTCGVLIDGCCIDKMMVVIEMILK